ncbi:MAG TPA: tyrosine-type recombinase/integrase [Coleofasciculaceae cyanobacterium]|jgi:integrase
MTGSKSQKSQTRKKEALPRTPRGNVSVTVREGRLRITVPAKYSPTGKQYHYALGCPDIPKNRDDAQVIVEQINARIHIFKDYDPQKLHEYIFGEAVSIETNNTANSSLKMKAEPTLDVLWEEFGLERLITGKIRKTTYKGYTKISRMIGKLPSKSLSDAVDIVSRIQKYSKTVSTPTLRIISKCCDWAVKKGLIKINPFESLIEGLRALKPKFNPDPFYEGEMERIGAAFAAIPKYNRYLSYIEFKDETGCRPAEANALAWRHVNLEKGEITFCEVISYIEGEYIAENGTKTVPTRPFPISPYLRELLKSIMPAQVKPDDFVFAEPDGSHFNDRKFGRVWRTIVSRLAQIPLEEGGISHYRPPNSTRHTYITETSAEMDRNGELTASNMALLADSVGNGVPTIYKFYLGRSQNREILYNPSGKKKLSSTSQPEDRQPENRGSDHSVPTDLTAELEERQRQILLLQQELDQLRSSQAASQLPVPVEEPIKSTLAPEAELIDLASVFTALDDLL